MLYVLPFIVSHFTLFPFVDCACYVCSVLSFVDVHLFILVCYVLHSVVTFLLLLLLLYLLVFVIVVVVLLLLMYILAFICLFTLFVVLLFCCFLPHGCICLIRCRLFSRCCGYCLLLVVYLISLFVCCLLRMLFFPLVTLITLVVACVTLLLFIRCCSLVGYVVVLRCFVCLCVVILHVVTLFHHRLPLLLFC